MGYSSKEVSDVIFFNKETNEEIMIVDSLNISFIENTSNENTFEYIPPISPISIELTKAHIDAEIVALVTGLNNEPLIKRLINIKRRTKSKRIRNKLNKRILNEINKSIF